MFAKQYYTLVAGLKEWALDADTKGFDAREIIDSVVEQLDGRDADAVRMRIHSKVTTILNSAFVILNFFESSLLWRKNDESTQ